MNFSWSSDDDAFRAKVRGFLKQELPANWDVLSRHGPGSREMTAFSFDFCAKLAAAGLLVPHWPVEYGGRDAPPWHHFILGEELWAAGEPRGPQYYNVNWLGPTVMKYGSVEQRQRFLPPMAAGRAVWCQGFSEPEAGSDLASLRTRAESRGDAYVINGSKVWTSYAAQAEHCFLLARTGGPGKRGISILLVPMSTPGIVVRPIPSLLGEGDIHEVFFDNVVVPQSCRMGEEGQAWPIIVYALANERVGIPRYAFSRRMLDRMVLELKRRGCFVDPIVKARAGQALAACEAARMLVYRVVDHRAQGSAAGADPSLARVAVVAADHAVADFALDFLPDALSSLEHPLFMAQHERAIASGIAAGAAEIQLNLIASGHLQLPREAHA